MVSRSIVCLPILDPISPPTFSFPGRTMLQKLELGKCFSLPPKHVGFNLIDRVPSGSDMQALNRFPALASINLCCTANMKPGIHFHFYRPIYCIPDCASRNSELLGLAKLFEYLLEIVARECQVSSNFA